MSDEGPGSLSDRIAAAKRAQAEKSGRQPDEVEQAGSSAGAQALRYGAEFGMSVFVGVLLGLGIDHLFGTRPWGVLIMMVFGFAAGIRSVIRAYRELTAEAQKIEQAGLTRPAQEEEKT